MSIETGGAAIAKPGKWRRSIFRCSVSLTFLAPAAAIALVLRGYPGLDPIISLSFLTAVSAAAWWAGICGGILTSLVTVPAITLCKTGGQSFISVPFNPVGLILLICFSILVATVANSRRRLEEVLRHANDALESKVAERTEELQRARNWFETTLESIGDAVIATDLAGRVTFMNGVAESLTGWKRAEAAGRQLNEVFVIINEETRRSGDNPVVQVLRNGAICGLANHTILVARDGREMPIDDSAAPIRDQENALAGVVLIFRDITQRRKDEKITEQARATLERTNQELQQFAFAASHDLQEPLRNVKIYSQLLGQRYRGKLDDDADQFIDFAVTGASRMEVLLADLLAYTQASGSADEESGPTDAKEALENVLSSLHAAITEAGACIRYDDLPVVPINQVHLQQVLQNLIGNAIKYRSDQAPSIHVSAQRTGREWVFCIRDNGIGIDLQYQQRIFGLFKRLHTQDQYAGTGIGLAICQKIVQRYGGRIWVESEPGAGSAFFFTCPRDQA